MCVASLPKFDKRRKGPSKTPQKQNIMDFIQIKARKPTPLGVGGSASLFF
jgi:hypothetical protein